MYVVLSQTSFSSVIYYTKKGCDTPMKPEQIKNDYDDTLMDDLNVISATECTGLMPTPPQTPAEWEAYQALYATELTSAVNNPKKKDQNP